MKKNIGSNIWRIYALLTICVFLGLTACKKSSSTSHSSNDNKLSFNYNGTQYSLSYMEWGIGGGGISISRPDLFEGPIYFDINYCAYLVPFGTSINISSNCEFFWPNGPPPDSAAVYLYQSGSMNMGYKNCESITNHDPYTGITTYYHICDADGTFDLVLKNNENKTITITAGSFQAYHFRRD